MKGVIAMNQRINQILFALLRSAVYGGQLKDTEKAVFSEEMLPQLLAISRKHDVAHLLAVGIDQNGLISEQLKKESKIEYEILKAVYRYERLNAEYKRICNALEKAEISFLPLKGSVIRKDYPEAWMRTSCDIDILVRKSDVDKAISYLVENHQYVFDWKGPKDVSLFSPSKQHIELHYSLMEDDVANSASEILQSVWDTATHKDGYNYWYEMPD